MRTRYGFLTLLLVASLLLPRFAHSQQKKPGAIAPAEKLADGWDEIDQRLIFLMVRLANLEASLDAVEKAIGKSTGKRSSSAAAAKRAEAGNERMDRQGGGPMKWDEFYGRTAEKFFYHPTDQNSSYNTVTVLSQQGPQADNKVVGGVPASQGLPAHQRPPQFDYIYRANENAKAKAEEEAAELRGKIESLLERRHRLEVEQAGLWCEVAFRAVSHYDLDQKPLYRFEPLIVAVDTESQQHVETMKTAVLFMRVALSIVAEAQKDQAATFRKIKPFVSNARLKLNDAFLRLAVDMTDWKSAEGRFAMLAKKLDDVASNLSDSYEVANEGDQAKDQQRKDTFRALLQESLVSYAQIILAMDEMATLMKDDWKIKPDVASPIQFVTPIVSAEAARPVTHDNAPIRDVPSDTNWSRGWKLNDAKATRGIVRLEGSITSISSPQSYSGPLKIVLVARTDSTNIRLGYGASEKTGKQLPGRALVIWNWEARPDQLRISYFGGGLGTANVAPLTPNTWYKLRWIVKEHGMSVFVNDELVYSENERTNDLSQKLPVTLSNGWNRNKNKPSVVEVKALEILKIQ